MNKFLWPLGLAAAIFSPAPLWAQNALTLDQALELAAARSPSLFAAAKEIEAADGAVRQAGLRRNPEWSSSVEDLRARTRTTTTLIGLPVELGDKRPARVAAAERSKDLAVADLALARAELRARVTAAYFGVLLAQERRSLAADSAAIAQRAKDAIGKRVAAGKASPVEDTRARVDLANSQLEAAEAQAELQTQRFSLALLLGQTSPSFERVAGEASAAPQRPALEALLAQLNNAPSLHTARLERERRIALVAVEQSKSTPDVLVSLGAKRNNEQGLTQAVLGLSIPLPVFDRNQGAILEALRRSEKASDELEATRLRLMAELQEAASRLAMAEQSLQTLQETVLPAAQQTYEAASKGLEAGKFGFLELLDAQRSLLQARSRYLNTLAGAHQAAAVIDRILGR
ncbi:TolC family protein [Curvibacter sp. RS43]|uniref:TolC family protein n=1 Tax=Curvibacter microcysteis TaxID=3026419 RepID=UPI002361C80E|nr:TolC family protein [Curvibacter sp. RS43]MDD0812886.1 TolC family protein [Curvibacter sp. RS43]